MDIVQERLEREYDIEVVQTAPTVPYQVLQATGEMMELDSAGDLPDPSTIEEFREPIVAVHLIVPADCIGADHGACPRTAAAPTRRPMYLSADRAILTYDFPLAEIIYDFHDKLKSVTRGYGTMDYELIGFHADDLVKLDILVHGNKVEALSFIVHQTKAEVRGRAVLQRLRKEIPRHQFDVPLQAAIGSRVIARETIKAYRKDVIGGCRAATSPASRNS